MIRAIVYDAVGTLMHVHPSVEAVYAAVGAEFGSKLTAPEIRTRFGSAFAAEDGIDKEAGWRTSERRERDRWRAIVGQVLDDVTDVNKCFEMLFRTFAEPAAWTFDADWPTVAAAMKRRGFRQAIASNFDARLRGLVRGMPAGEVFERVIVSSEVGWRKPAPQFFEHVAQSLQLPPGEILFVGDDRANDYEPAIAAGMASVLVDQRDKHRDVGADRVRRLAEIVTWSLPSRSASEGQTQARRWRSGSESNNG